MPEIVKKTGINRKAWNQRFSRLEKKSLVTNNIAKLYKGDKKENVSILSGANGDELGIVPAKIINNIGRQNKAKKFLAALAVISIMLTIYFAYLESKRKRDKTYL